MQVKTFTAYEINELDDKKALWTALNWLNRMPLDYENDRGEMVPQYWDDIWHSEGEDFVIEHCKFNGYLFDEYGYPVHHLTVK